MKGYPNVILAILVMGLMACSSNDDEAGGQTFRLFWPDSKGNYDFRNVKINSFSDYRELRGEETRVYVNPTVSNNRVNGEPPNARFIKTGDGVLVPANVMTHQGTVVYGHIEKLKEMAIDAGLDKSKKSPQHIFFHNKLKFGSSDRFSSDNAHFVPSLDAVIMVPFKKGNNLPTSLNAGIIAHEYFHNLFTSLAGGMSLMSEANTNMMTDIYYWVNANDQVLNFNGIMDDSDLPMELPEILPNPDEDCPELTREEIAAGRRLSNCTLTSIYNTVIFGALNEGLADFWGFLYTGDKDYFAKTFDGDRKLEGESQIPSESRIKFALESIPSGKMQGTMGKLFYPIGTQYARYLYDLYKEAMNGEKLEGTLFDVSAINIDDSSVVEVGSKKDKEIRKVFMKGLVDFSRQVGNHLESLDLKVDSISSDLLTRQIFKTHMGPASVVKPSQRVCKVINKRGALKNLRKIHDPIYQHCECEIKYVMVDGDRVPSTVVCGGAE